MGLPAADPENAIHSVDSGVEVNGRATSKLTEPLRYSGSLEQYNYVDVTPAIGREFPKLQVSDVLSDDAKIQDLAITGEFRLQYSCVGSNSFSYGKNSFSS